MNSDLIISMTSTPIWSELEDMIKVIDLGNEAARAEIARLEEALADQKRISQHEADCCEAAKEKIELLEKHAKTLADAIENFLGCFDAAISEGLLEVVSNTPDDRLKDLLERRILTHATLPAEEALHAYKSNDKKSYCTDERPCINCFADQGPCLGPYKSTAKPDHAEALAAALEQARNGLQWYQDTYPQATSGADDDAMATIDAALAAYNGNKGGADHV